MTQYCPAVVQSSIGGISQTSCLWCICYISVNSFLIHTHAHRRTHARTHSHTTHTLPSLLVCLITPSIFVSFCPHGASGNSGLGKTGSARGLVYPLHSDPVYTEENAYIFMRFGLSFTRKLRFYHGKRKKKKTFLKTSAKVEISENSVFVFACALG